MKSPYDILGVSNSASKEEIDKAYRDLARKHHPDKHQTSEAKAEAEIKFKEVTAAYEQIQNPEKSTSFRGNRPFTSPLDDFVSHFFRDPFKRSSQPRGEDIVVEQNISLEEVYHGGTREIMYSLMEICQDCNGQGGNVINCSHCQGSGYRTIYGPAMTVRTSCQACGGTGRMIQEKCPNCQHGFRLGKEGKIDFTIPRGVDDGMRFVFHGMGQPCSGGSSGNLFVVVSVTPHELFKRLRNGDILCRVTVSYSELVLGAEKSVPTLGKGCVSFKIPPGTQDHTKFRLKGMGLPFFTNGEVYNFGDQMVQVELEVPTEFDDEYSLLVTALADYEQRNMTPLRKAFVEMLGDEHELK